MQRYKKYMKFVFKFIGDLPSVQDLQLSWII